LSPRGKRTQPRRKAAAGPACARERRAAARGGVRGEMADNKKLCAGAPSPLHAQLPGGVNAPAAAAPLPAATSARSAVDVFRENESGHLHQRVQVATEHARSRVTAANRFAAPTKALERSSSARRKNVDDSARLMSEMLNSSDDGSPSPRLPRRSPSGRWKKIQSAAKTTGAINRDM
jgi:hypothetical protein